MLVRHKVDDFRVWKVVYDEHLSAREAAGLRESHLFRNLDNPHEVVILFEAPDLEKARAFAMSEDLRDTMKNAGVIDQPDIYYLD